VGTHASTSPCQYYFGHVLEKGHMDITCTFINFIEPIHYDTLRHLIFLSLLNFISRLLVFQRDCLKKDMSSENHHRAKNCPFVGKPAPLY